MALTDTSIEALRRQLKARDISSVALAEALIERTQACAALNGYASFDPAHLLLQAREADARIAAGEDLPLLGVPIALKDNIDATGLPSAAGTAALQGLYPAADAEVTARLRAAGALIAGKASMHELAFGVTNDNHVTGMALNPWDRGRIPGGSSGGSGVVVAAGMVPAAIGTDTGGSVRVPAALCGLVGLRPTVGRVSGKGIAPISTTRDTAGPLARTVADCALLDAVLTGDAAALPEMPLDQVRLGLPDRLFWDDLAPGVRVLAEAALERLRAAGAVLVPVALPEVAELNAAVGFPIVLHEFVRDMADYLADAGRGVSLEALVAGIQSPDVRQLVQPLLRDGAVPEAAYRQALQARTRLQAMYAQAFAATGVHALVFPTTPLVACSTRDKTEVVLNGQVRPLFPTFIRNTDPGSNAGLPGVSVPIGLHEGLPVGLGLDGAPGSDRLLLSIATHIERQSPPVSAPWMR